MVPKDDAYNTVEFEDYYYVIKSSFRNFERRFNGGKPLPECFEYNSGTNQWLLTREMIKCFGHSSIGFKRLASRE
jgi:UDP-N-acetylglucosamine 4,6-dehydratase/5-epimerase